MPPLQVPRSRGARGHPYTDVSSPHARIKTSPTGMGLARRALEAAASERRRLGQPAAHVRASVRQVRTSVLLGLRSYAPGRHDWNVSARVVSDVALLQASFDQQPARRLLERKLQPLRAGDLFVWLGQAGG